MRNTCKLALTALAAALVLASAVSSASAGHLSVSNTSFRIVWAPLTFQGAIFGSVRCNVTMEGTFHSATIQKVIGALIGHITEAAVSHPCTGGEGWAANGRESILGVVQRTSLPWHVTYEGFRGTLPNIEFVTLLLALTRFYISIPFLCLSIYGPNKNITGEAKIAAGGAITTLTSNGENIAQESGTCGSGSFQGEGQVTLLGASTRITVTLI